MADNASPLSRPADEIIAELNARLETELSPFLDGKPFALVDFPDHANVGDSAIWLGETAFFARHGQRPAYVSSLKTHDDAAMARAIGSGTIFLHGGGNFGTLWPAHQDFRLHLMERFPGHRIVQLPQSIHFNDESAAADTARAIERHGKFTLFVRDNPSLDFARRHFLCQTILAPDMAFCMPRPRRSAPVHDIFCLLRTDHEKSIDGAGIAPGVEIGDWLDENRAQMRRTRIIAKLLGLADAGGPTFRIFENAARARVQRGIEQLSSGRVVVTDRLHGHILSLLAGIPQVTLDNSYRKLGNFIDAWTASLDNHRTATSPAQAMVEAKALLSAEVRA